MNVSFVKGQSGNPLGRPKKGQSITELLMKKLSPEVLADKIVARIEAGDKDAIKLYWQYADGMPTQKLEVEQVNPYETRAWRLIELELRRLVWRYPWLNDEITGIVERCALALEGIDEPDPILEADRDQSRPVAGEVAFVLGEQGDAELCASEWEIYNDSYEGIPRSEIRPDIADPVDLALTSAIDRVVSKDH